MKDESKQEYIDAWHYHIDQLNTLCIQSAPEPTCEIDDDGRTRTAKHYAEFEKIKHQLNDLVAEAASRFSIHTYNYIESMHLNNIGKDNDQFTRAAQV